MNPTERAAVFAAEARRIASYPTGILEAVIVNLLLEAGYEPDPENPDTLISKRKGA